MNKVKKCAAGLMMVVLALSMVACDNSQHSKKTVIATVNGENIYQSDYDALYDEYFNYFGGTDEAAAYLSTQKQLILDELISNKVLMQKAKELKISCSEEEVDEAYDKIELQYGEETVKQMLEFSSLTEEQYKAMIKEQLILGKLQEIMIAGDIEVTDEMLKAYYNEHISDYTTSAGGKMKHILVRIADENNKEEVAAAEKAMQQIQQELADGMTFEQLYDKYSKEDAQNALYIAEDLGFVPYDSTKYDKDFLNGVRTIEEGKVSGPIKTSFGYHFVKVEDITEAITLPLEEVKEQVTVAVKDEEEYNLYTACLKKWTDEAKIVTYKERIS